MEDWTGLSSHPLPVAGDRVVPLRVLSFFDGPDTFVFEGSAQTLFAHLADADDETRRFFVRSISTLQEESLTDGSLFLRDFLLASDPLFVMDLARDGQVRNVFLADINSLPSDVLPYEEIAIEPQHSHLEPHLADLKLGDRSALQEGFQQTLKVVQRNAGTGLTLDQVLSVLRPYEKLFSTLFESVFSVPPRILPTGARLGSFVLTSDVQWEASSNVNSDALRTLVSMMDSPSIEASLIWAELADVLKEFSVDIEVEFSDGKGLAAKLRITHSALVKILKTGAVSTQLSLKRPSRLLTTREIPQANDLLKVFRVVELIADTGYVNSQSLGVTERQVSYYKDAGRILGFLAYDRPTPAGRLLALKDKNERMAVAVIHFESSRCGEQWITFSGGKTLLDVKQSTAEAFLRESAVQLSGSTLLRRASTLEKWRLALLPHHYDVLSKTNAGSS